MHRTGTRAAVSVLTTVALKKINIITIVPGLHGRCLEVGSQFETIILRVPRGPEAVFDSGICISGPWGSDY